MSGLGTSTQTSNTGAQTTTGPFAPVVAPETNLISSEQNLATTAPYSDLPSSAQTGEFGALQGNLSALQGGPNLGSEAQSAAGGLLGGDPLGLLAQQSANLSPIANEGANGGAGLNPMNTPGMQGVLSTIQNDVQNSVNSQFAGAGRSLSGLNEQAVARGLSQGEAQPLLAQYNQNVSNMQGANTALGSLGSQYTSNLGAGNTLGAAAPALAGAIPTAQLAGQQLQTQLPYQNLALQENILNPIAGLGGTSVGTTQGSGSATASPLSVASQLGNIGSSIGGLFGSIL